MPRKRVIVRREIATDPRYNNLLVAKFVSSLLKKGKRSLAQSILYGAFDIMQQKAKEEPLSLFQKALGNVKPVVEVRSRRVGGSTYQVPTEVRASRGQALAIRWISFAKREELPAKLAGVMDAAAGRGAAVKQRRYPPDG
jgi:small subunit ribosomal protein S7